MRKNAEMIKSILLIIVGLTLMLNSVLLMNAKKTIAQQKQTICNYEELKIMISELAERYDKILAELEKSKVSVNKTIVSTENASSQSVRNYSEANGKFSVGEQIPLPSLPTNVKACTDYRCYNLRNTPHYRLQQAARTDEVGLRRFNDDYIVAMGAFYSTDIGDRFKVTLDTGREFTVILGDGKAPHDCDELNMYSPCKNYNGESCANILEFIMDSDVLSSKVYAYGSIDCLDEFKGNIVKMEYLGRDSSANWDLYE